MNNRPYPLILSTVVLLVIMAGCGLITDKDRWPVAKLDDEVITRGELFDIIWNMPDSKRPVIRTKYDLRRVLEQIIDDRIKKPLGKKLAEDGLISVSREEAREYYFLESGEDEQDLRLMWSMDLEAGGEALESTLKSYGLTVQAVQIQKDFIEQETDKMLERILADRAISYLAWQEERAGRLTVDEKDIQMEYEVRKPELLQLEELSFSAISLPDVPGARDEIASVRKRLDDGESFDDLLNEYFDKGEHFVMQPTIQNDPNSKRFRGFWAQLSGAQPGEIHGPLFFPPSQQLAQGPDGQPVIGADGQPVREELPAQWMILQVTNQVPESTMTLEDIMANENLKEVFLRPLLVARMMERLREEHGVEIYEDKLPDPAGFENEYGESILDL